MAEAFSRENSGLTFNSIIASPAFYPENGYVGVDVCMYVSYVLVRF